MFFSGLITSIVGLVIFRNLEESPIFAELKAKRAAAPVELAPVESPLRVLFSPAYLPGFLGTLLLSFGGGAAYYLTLGYLPSFFKIVNGLPNATASLILVGANVAAAIGAAAWGELSQHIGRRMSFLVIGIIRLFAFPLMFIAMGQTNDLTLIVIYALLISSDRQRQLRAAAHLPERALPDSVACDGNRPVMECRLRARRHAADVHFADREFGDADPDGACDLHVRRDDHLHRGGAHGRRDARQPRTSLSLATRQQISAPAQARGPQRKTRATTAEHRRMR